MVPNAQWLQEVWTFEFHQPIFKKVTSAGLNSLQQERCQNQLKIGFLMVRSTKMDQYWLF